MVESNRDPLAYNKNENACGQLQIRPVMIDDVNRILEKINDDRHYSLQDAFDPGKSAEIWFIVQNWYNPEYDYWKATQIWNAKDWLRAISSQ